ncbi:carboxylesterase family protein [Aurantivibrio plasticivorans]
MSKPFMPLMCGLLVAAGLTACSESSNTSTSSAAAPESQSAPATVAVDNTIGDVVNTPLGAVRGESVTEVGATARIYKGLPYATPPTGDLRWKAPQPPQAWDGERETVPCGRIVAHKVKAAWALADRSVKTAYTLMW